MLHSQNATLRNVAFVDCNAKQVDKDADSVTPSLTCRGDLNKSDGVSRIKIETGYYEYNGSDYQTDMDALAREPRNIAWLEQCDPCQIPLTGHDSWVLMTEVYHND